MARRGGSVPDGSPCGAEDQGDSGMVGRSRRRGFRGKLLGPLLSALLLGSSTAAGWVPAARAATDARIARSSDGVALRELPDYGATVLGVLADGAAVDLRIDRFDTVYDPDGQTRWWPVATDLGEGWVAGFFLDLPGGDDDGWLPPAVSDAETVQPSVAVGGGDGGLSGRLAQIIEPDGVNVRAEPSTASEAVSQLRLGDQVTLRIDVLDTVYAEGTRWWPVASNGGDGWVSGDYLTAFVDPTAGAPPTVSEAPAISAEEIAAFVANAYVQVLTDDGTGLNVRADPAPDAETIGSVLEGDVIQVMDGPTYDPLGNPWYLTTDGEATGWTIGTYLVEAAQPPVPGDAEPADPPPAAAFAAEELVRVLTDDGTGLNLRANPAPDADRIGSIPDDDVVRIVDGPSSDDSGDPWYLVTAGDETGWVTGAYLVETDPTALHDDDEAEAAPVLRAGVATGSFQYPLERFTFTQGFGCSPYWFEPWVASVGCNFHNGVDLAQDAYTPLLAADGGVVEQAGWCDCGLGYYVKIDHGNGFKTVYGHMAEMPWVAPGDQVAKGDQVGPVGSTGNSTGPHVHFIVQADGVDVDPLGFLP